MAGAGYNRYDISTNAKFNVYLIQRNQSGLPVY